MMHAGCWGRKETRDNLGKGAGEKGKRRMTGKGREERKKVGNPWGNKWRWTKEVPGKAPREPVLWSSDQGIKGTGGTSGM